MDPRYYGEVVHDFYDLIYPPYDVPEQVSFFQGIAAEGAKVLDLGAGTGRIAIPLAQAGFEVTGLDISQPMLDVLHDKDPLSSVTTALKDISVIDGAHEFDLVLCIGSTFFMVLDDLPRQNVFRNAAANLLPRSVRRGVLLAPDVSSRSGAVRTVRSCGCRRSCPPGLDRRGPVRTTCLALTNVDLSRNRHNVHGALEVCFPQRAGPARLRRRAPSCLPPRRMELHSRGSAFSRLYLCVSTGRR